MRNLKYEKIHNSNTAIIVDLHNGYSVKAISGYDMSEEMYHTALYIKENHSDLWMEIDRAENLTFDANSKNIALTVLNAISEYEQIGFFNEYIQTYEYYLKCFDLGNTQLEIESGRPNGI